MITFPTCKINIGLNITSRRPDGYHNISTIFYPVMLCDALEFVEAGSSETRDNLVLTGINLGDDGHDNIVLRAASLVRELYGIPALKIHLHKAIPPGAGLGGGSSDAAFLVKSLNRYFKLVMPEERIMEIALNLGSDCPFFIDSAPACAGGRGEILTPVPEMLKGYYLLLVNPGVKISTAEAYRNCVPAVPERGLEELIALPPEEWKHYIRNDFESFAVSRHPVIGSLKEELYRQGALFSLMSGSGSSVFGIFSHRPVLTGMLQKHTIWEGLL